MKVILLQNGMTQTEIASRMGVAQPHVSAWLNGNRVPNSTNLRKMANALDIPVGVLASTLSDIQNSL